MALSDESDGSDGSDDSDDALSYRIAPPVVAMVGASVIREAVTDVQRPFPTPSTPCGSSSRAFSDPARVSHISVSLSVRHPSGVAGSLTMPDPRVIGATPLDRVAKKRAPTRGACLHPRVHPFPTGANPDRPFPTGACSNRLCPPGGGSRGDDFTPTDGSR